MSSRRTKKRDRIPRQSFENRLSHWLVAGSTFALIFTGFGQMPMYSRYGIADLPGMAWAADYHLTLLLHYVSGAVLVFAVVFHVSGAILTKRFALLPRKGDLRESIRIIAAMLGKGEEPPSGKYLAEQRLAYAFIGTSILVVVVSGIIKVLKNLPGVDMHPLAIFAATTAHNIAAVLIVLGVAGHLAAFMFKENRSLLPAMFDGTVDRTYAARRHPLWYRGRNRTDAPAD
ncbi:MAG TPA: cytochrome b/b6 domain-containing protein [Coriobacteriia bacterium]|nr:cytochrome b/b6 domain-containing protein [Coriobacteriia bacterium]